VADAPPEHRPPPRREGALPDDVAEHMGRLGHEGCTDFRMASLRDLVLARLRAGSVLDYGCGTGHVAVAAAAAGRRVTAVDVAPEMREAARGAAERAGIELEVRAPDELGDERFDNVLCLDVVEHIEDEVPLLAELRDRLTDQGRLILTVPAHPSLYGTHDSFQGHYRRYTRGVLRQRLERAGLEVERMRHWAMLGAAARWFWLRVLRRDLELAGLRYGHGRRTRLQAAANWALRTWLSVVENRVPFPFGLTLLALARRAPTPPR